MCQHEQSKADAALRQVLENMCYKACTPADLVFLHSCISSDILGDPCILNEEFCDISIITALNIHKDTLNSIGSHRFSLETGQALVHFYSEDRLTSKCGDSPNRKAYRRLPKQKAPVLTDEIQQHLCFRNKQAQTVKG